MQNLTRRPAAEHESMDQLLGDCARMAPHWSSPGPDEWGPGRTPRKPSVLRGVRVPPAYARLLDGMSEYGD